TRLPVHLVRTLARVQARGHVLEPPIGPAHPLERRRRGRPRQRLLEARTRLKPPARRQRDPAGGDGTVGRQKLGHPANCNRRRPGCPGKRSVRARALGGPGREDQRSGITRILSSPGRWLPRPSRLLVMHHKEPSGARTTARGGPWAPVKGAIGAPPSPERASGICHSRSPRSAAAHRLPAAIAAPDGDAWSVVQVTSGSAYLPPPPAPSTA